MSAKCKLCGETSFVTKHLVADCIVAACRSCDLVQVVNSDSAAEIYDGEYFEHDKRSGPANHLEQKRRLAWLRNSGLPRGKRVLDAGCATGEFLAVADERYDVYGVDISDAAVEKALSAFPFLSGKVRAGALEDVDFGTVGFDAIVMWDVIEHLHDPRSMVLKLSETLKPDGMMFISTPNIDTLTAMVLGRRWPFMTPPEHQCFFSRKTLARLMESCGFEHTAAMSRGKWVNIRFLLYKIERVFPGALARKLTRGLARVTPSTFMVYAPTGDVLYTAFRRKA